MVDSSKRTVLIHVRLLDEAVEVCRPTQALDLGNGLFQILDTPTGDAAEEVWEFQPGAVVRAENRVDSEGEKYLFAVAKEM